jgi:hypothetical protein
VKHIDSSGELRNKNDTEHPSGVPNPNFLNPRANSRHRFPVVWLSALLYLVDLMTRLAPCRYRKGSKIIQGTGPKFDGFAIGHRIALYNFLYIDARLRRLTLTAAGVFAVLTGDIIKSTNLLAEQLDQTRAPMWAAC